MCLYEYFCRIRLQSYREQNNHFNFCVYANRFLLFLLSPPHYSILPLSSRLFRSQISLYPFLWHIVHAVIVAFVAFFPSMHRRECHFFFSKISIYSINAIRVAWVNIRQGRKHSYGNNAFETFFRTLNSTVLRIKFSSVQVFLHYGSTRLNDGSIFFCFVSVLC